MCRASNMHLWSHVWSLTREIDSNTRGTVANIWITSWLAAFKFNFATHQFNVCTMFNDATTATTIMAVVKKSGSHSLISLICKIISSDQ